MKKRKIATVPTPPTITTAVLETVRHEAQAWREAYNAQTKSMEQLSERDLSVRTK